MLSIIIPVLNEAKNITNVLQHLVTNASEINKIQVIIVDGGSSDNTAALVTSFAEISKANIILISSEKGRARQMNAGARKATGKILYFLHADSFPPKNYDDLIIQEIAKGNPAGCFKMKFDSSHWWLKLASWFTQFSWRACRGGDQSQFITHQLFNEIGGFDETYTIYEDNILISELYARNKFVVIQQWIISSARLYEEHGVWNLQYHFFTIYFKKWMGADADELYAYYLKNIKQQRAAKVEETAAEPVKVFSDK